MSERRGALRKLIATSVAAAFLLAAADVLFAAADVPPDGLTGGAPAADNVAADNVATDNVATDNVSIGTFIKKEMAATGKAADVTHVFLERQIFERVVWFDDFFGNVKTEETRHPEYVARWTNSVRWDEGGKFKYRTAFRLNVRLPKLTERLRLVVAGESEAEPTTAPTPEDPGNPGFDRTLQNARVVNTELRYGFIKTQATDLFLGAGVRLVLPVETFVRARIQLTRSLGPIALARFAETVFWRSLDGLGETTELDLERRLNPKTLLRWTNAGTLSQETPGLQWGSDLSLLRELSPKSAGTVAAGLFGVTRPLAVVQSYRVLARYRRNFLRPWLFFELEPELSWPRNPEGAYTSAWAFTTRLEVVFQGTAATMEKSSARP